MANEWEQVSEAWERVGEAAVKLGEALSEGIVAFGEWVSAAAKPILDALASGSIIEAAAYAAAKKEHPEWVYRAEHNKKRRIRKKYHDRIMREYGGAFYW